MSTSFQREELEYAFRKFDIDSNGFITVNEFKQLLAEDFGLTFNNESISNLIQTVDADSDGRLNFAGLKNI